MFENILLAVDGSEHGLRAAKMAGDLARAMRSADLHAVVAYDPIPPYIGDPYMQYAIDARLKDSEEILRKTLEAIGEIPGELHTELLEGSAAEAIVKVATTRQSDVIVIGSRGLGRLAGALLGSTSQKVISHAPCPVLVVR
ncbi:MAG: universal stress protein [Chloroflexota bacterium]